MALMGDLRWCDSDSRLHPGVWRGLILTAAEAARPGFAVEVCDPLCIRLSARGEPILWARIENGYWGYELLRTLRQQSLNVLPPIRFALAEQNSADVSAGSNRAWARTFAEMLSTSTASPIVGGRRWLLGLGSNARSGSDLSPDLVHKIVSQRSYGYIQWDFSREVCPITLRELSAPDSGRVKAWRKHARAGTLPPVLLYHVSGLAAYVVLDGHDRLLAASLEGKSAPALRLESLSEEGRVRDQGTRDAVLRQVSTALDAAERERARPAGERLARAQTFLDTDNANKLLLDAFVPHHDIRPTSARPLPGGLDRWVAEVASELAVQKIQDTGLLEGLTSLRRREDLY